MPAKRLPTNAPGDFYVDASCIDCDTCRWMAPETFDRASGQSRVHQQPAGPVATRRALGALLACPTTSIHTEERHAIRAVMDAFPAPIEGDVFHCGYHSEQSFGAAAYLIVRDGGRDNVLIDSPRFAAPLIRRIEELGGVATMFLTHKDDVADHARFAERFGCTRILHAADQTRGTRDVERILRGDAAVRLDDELEVIPTPGHTAGSCCLRYRDRFLFTGDHLAARKDGDGIYAFRTACWFDWTVQIGSVERLIDVPFEWLLPGHGRRGRFTEAQARAALIDCVAEMRRPA